MKIMAIDYGENRTGVALSDATGFLTGRTFLIKSRKQDAVIEQLLALAREQGAEEMVLGHPLNMDGTIGPRAEKCQALAQRLRARTDLPVVLWDERRTTVDAHRILFEAGKNGKKRKKIVDAVAASLILEGYLDFRRMKQGQEESL